MPGRPWCLINASPDLRTQILSDSEFAPQTSPRHSPIAAVVLTSADVDQVMGLLHLREFEPMRIYAAPPVQKILREDNSIFRALEQTQNQAHWSAIHSGARCELETSSGENLDLVIEPVWLDGRFPGYHGKSESAAVDSRDAVLGLFVESRNGTRPHRMFCAPSLPRIDENWLAAWDQCDAILIDGTFWSDDELVRTRGDGNSAREMGHVPISGSGGTLEALAKLKRARKIFYHINNTNPILDEDSPEHARVAAAGWEIAYDGMKIEL